MSQAPKNAPIVPNMPNGVQPMANSRTVQLRRICCQATMYQRSVPLDMKHKSTAKTSGRKEGAFQISRGRKGVFANLYSQSTKTRRRKMDVKIRTIS